MQTTRSQHWGRNAGWECWRTRCWGRYFEAESVGEQSAEEDICSHEGLGDRGSGKEFNTRRSMICTSHQLFGWWNQEEWDGWGMWHIRGREGAYGDLVGRPEGYKNLKDRGVDGSIILNWVFKKWNGVAWTGLIYLRVRTVGGFLWMR